jgi:hypothetical protein
MAIPFKDKHIEHYSKWEPVMHLNDQDRLTEYEKHQLSHEFINSKWTFYTCGQLFLYEKGIWATDKTVTLSYPKIGIFLNSTIVDQTLEIEWAHYRRSWEYNRIFEYVYEDKTYKSTYNNIDTRIEQMILWQDDLLIYGIWNKLPSFSELKKSYETTFWYKKTEQQKRDIKIQSILKHEQ